MDFQSRDRYRHAVEELAEPTGEAQLRVALRCVESARQASEQSPGDDRASHVGYHLIGGGRQDLETDVAYRPRLPSRVRRFLFARATGVYLGSIAFVTAGLLVAALAYARLEGAPPLMQACLALVLLLPASELAVALLQRIAARVAPPRRLPRLDLQGGLPENARTLVVVPALLTSVEGVGELLERLEVHALGNMDPHVHFAILGDFADAPAAEMPEDEAILAAARRGIEALNQRYGQGSADRFYLLHRFRQWNPQEGCWMGW
jgi:cyclic beta-1,2-glucan synthetase